jgi:hypothetical protein
VTGESALLTTAEVAVAFAGFASVVTAFQRREQPDWAAQDVLRFQLMIASSLSVVLFALLPFAMVFFGANEPRALSLSSSLLALYLAVSAAVTTRRAYLLARGQALNPFISASFFTGALIALALQVSNVAGLFAERELGPYFVGLLYLLVLAGMSFARMLPVARRSAGS